MSIIVEVNSSKGVLDPSSISRGLFVQQVKSFTTLLLAVKHHLSGHASTAGPFFLQPNSAGLIHEYLHLSNKLSWHVKSALRNSTKPPPVLPTPTTHPLHQSLRSRAKPHPSRPGPCSASHLVPCLQSCPFNGVFQRQPPPCLAKEILLSLLLKSLFRLSVTVRRESKILISFAGSPMGLSLPVPWASPFPTPRPCRSISQAPGFKDMFLFPVWACGPTPHPSA